MLGWMKQAIIRGFFLSGDKFGDGIWVCGMVGNIGVLNQAGPRVF